jgi:hypothetical protein
MPEVQLAYRIWQCGLEWHWQVVLESNSVLVSGVADTQRERPCCIALRTATTIPNNSWWNHASLFFHLHGSGGRDAEGQEFADDNAAIQEARAVARDLSHNWNPSSQERVVVTNEKGDVVHEEPLFRA